MPAPPPASDTQKSDTRTQRGHALQPRSTKNPFATWAAFLAMTIAVVGLVGLFATYACVLPLQRAMARDIALDDAAAALQGAAPAAAIEALRPRLDDSAAALLPIGGDMPARIAAERTAMHARFAADAEVTAVRVRWMIGIVTVMSIVFGAAILKIASRS
jgi:hypothetical protein